MDLGGLADKAKDLIADNDDKIKGGVEKVGDFVGGKIGHDKVDKVEDAITGFVDKIAAEREEAPRTEG